jgi:hypothetical protein
MSVSGTDANIGLSPLKIIGRQELPDGNTRLDVVTTKNPTFDAVKQCNVQIIEKNLDNRRQFIIVSSEDASKLVDYIEQNKDREAGTFT